MEYTEHQQSLLRKLEQLQKDEGLSLSALSARLGISKGALSQLFSGSYQANPQKMFAKLESYFGVKDQTRQTYQESGYADTSISTEIYDIIGVCQIKGGLAIAAGDAGIGKTKAAQHFVAEHPNNSVLITLNPCLTSIKSLLRLIADRIGAPMERSRDALWYSIRQKLSDGTVLIFDESQKEGNNEIWIDCYELVKFLRMNQSQVAKVEGTKEWERVYDQREPEG